jgi:hypothetical protein
VEANKNVAMLLSTMQVYVIPLRDLKIKPSLRCNKKVKCSPRGDAWPMWRFCVPAKTNGIDAAALAAGKKKYVLSARLQQQEVSSEKSPADFLIVTSEPRNKCSIATQHPHKQGGINGSKAQEPQ